MKVGNLASYVDISSNASKVPFCWINFQHNSEAKCLKIFVIISKIQKHLQICPRLLISCT